MKEYLTTSWSILLHQIKSQDSEDYPPPKKKYSKRNNKMSKIFYTYSITYK